MRTIYLAGGCFWGMQRFMDQFDGVLSTETGYANGPDNAPTYRDVCSDSGHAETVRVTFDENRISLEDILDYYFMVIDPLSVNRQGEDEGIQYRTGIYCTDASMLETVNRACERQSAVLGAPLAVETGMLVNFFPAEEYHQKYLEKNPSGYCHIPARFFSLNGRKGEKEHDTG